MPESKYLKYGAYHWKAYENDADYRAHVDTVKRFFRSMTKGWLLDAGCGDGFISEQISQMGFRVVGIDPDAEAVRLARERCNPGIEFAAEALEDSAKRNSGPGCPAEPFDYVLMSDVLEYVADDLAFLRMGARLSKAGVLATVQVIDPSNPGNGERVREYDEPRFTELMVTAFKNVFMFKVGAHLYAWGAGRRGD